MVLIFEEFEVDGWSFVVESSPGEGGAVEVLLQLLAVLAADMLGYIVEWHDGNGFNAQFSGDIGHGAQAGQGIGANGEIGRCADFESCFFLQFMEACQAEFYFFEATFDASDVVVNFPGAVNGYSQMDITDPDNIGSEFVQQGAIGVDGGKKSLFREVFQEFDGMGEEEGFAAAEEEGRDIMSGGFIHESFPVCQGHLLFESVLLVVHISFPAPLGAHPAPEIAGICQGKRDISGEIHKLFLTTDVHKG